VRARFTDSDAVAEAARCDVHQLGPEGDAELLNVQLVSGSLQALRSTFNLATHGDRPPGVVTFVRSSTPGLLLNGRRVQPNQIWSYGPGSEVQGVFPPGSELTLLVLPWERLRSSTNGDGETAVLGSGPRVLSLPRPLASTIAGILDGALNLARRDPGAFQKEVCRQHIEEDLVEHLALASRAAGRPPRHRGPEPVSRSQVLRLARAALADREEEPLRVADLCAACGVSERTLRNVFYDAFGMSPMRYLRLARLNAARRDLRRIDPDEATVAEVAMRRGFWHPGTFSVLYRQTFGERPSDTLGRRR
jgi:AraC-like DNA-binding protein